MNITIEPTAPLAPICDSHDFESCNDYDCTHCLRASLDNAHCKAEIRRLQKARRRRQITNALLFVIYNAIAVTAMVYAFGWAMSVAPTMQ